MPATVAPLNPLGGRPTIEIVVGNGHFGSFQVFLFDVTGVTPQKFGEGDTDAGPNTFQIPGSPLTVLDQRIVRWRAVIESFTGAAGEEFIVTANVIQDQNIVASHSKDGPITDPPPEGSFRLQMG